MKKFQMNKVALGIALVIGATGTQVMAQANSFEEAKQQVNAGKRVVEVGFAKEATPALKGFATSLPLVEVLKQITPNGWLVKKSDTADNRIDITKPVSWSGGNAWNITLDSVVRQAGTNAVIDWDKKEVTLVSVSRPVSNTVTVKSVESVKATNSNVGADGISVFELESGVNKNVPAITQTAPAVSANNKVQSDVVTTGETNYTSVQTTTTTVQQIAVAPAPVQAPAQKWRMDSGKSLKDNVIAWGKQAGYKVEWIGEDYPARDDDFFGEFDSENGPIHQLSVDYGKNSRVKVPLSFLLYQNGVLVVENMKYEQQGFPQFGQ